MGPEDDVSAQRPEIGDNHAREMAAKKAFLLTSCQLRVSEDWVVADAVFAKPVSKPKFPANRENNREFCNLRHYGSVKDRRNPCTAGTSRAIPYFNKQGIFFA